MLLEDGICIGIHMIITYDIFFEHPVIVKQLGQKEDPTTRWFAYPSQYPRSQKSNCGFSKQIVVSWSKSGESAGFSLDLDISFPTKASLYR